MTDSHVVRLNLGRNGHEVLDPERPAVELDGKPLHCVQAAAVDAGVGRLTTVTLHLEAGADLVVRPGRIVLVDDRGREVEVMALLPTDAVSIRDQESR